MNSACAAPPTNSNGSMIHARDGTRGKSAKLTPRTSDAAASNQRRRRTRSTTKPAGVWQTKTPSPDSASAIPMES